METEAKLSKRTKAREKLKIAAKSECYTFLCLKKDQKLLFVGLEMYYRYICMHKSFKS